MSEEKVSNEMKLNDAQLENFSGGIDTGSQKWGLDALPSEVASSIIKQAAALKSNPRRYREKILQLKEEYYASLSKSNE